MSSKKQEQSFGWVEDFRREQLKKSARNPGLAAIFSFFVMGMGQIYAGHIDRGVIFMFINAFSLIAGYSIYSGGLVYNWLMSLTGANGIMILSYVASVIYILIWIYNIKDAYYLSIFSSFRDWFEVERVLLPSMGVPSDLLLSSKNSNPLEMLENKSGIKNTAEAVPQQQTELKPELELEKEDENVINITLDSEKKEAEIVPENTSTTELESESEPELEHEIASDIEADEQEEEDDLTDSEAAGLVYMNYSSWKLFGAAFLVLVGAGAGIYYFNSDYSKESSLQLAKDFALVDKNKVSPVNVASSSAGQSQAISGETHHASIIATSSKQPVDAYPILMTQSQIDSYVDWRMKSLLAAREKRRYATIYSEDENDEIPLIVSSDIDDGTNDETEVSNNEVIFVQGHKDAKILKKTNSVNISENTSNTLYVAPDEGKEDDGEDVQLIMTDESDSAEIQEPVIEQENVAVPNVDKTVLERLKKEKETEKAAELEQNVKQNEINDNVATNTVDETEKRDEKNNITPLQETPEIKAALERIKERGAYEFYRGNWEAALPFYFELLKYHRNAEAFEMVGIIFEKMNKLSDAYDAYENAYKLGMNSRNNVTRLGLIGEKLGRYEDAQRYLEMAIEKSPKRADIILSYARCLDKQGESMAAAKVLAVLRDSTNSYAIKQAAEQGYQDIVKAREKKLAIQKELEKAVTTAIKNKK